MNKSWTRLVILGAVLVLIVVFWDVFTLATGIKQEFRYTIYPIDPILFGETESHLREGRYFDEHIEQAALEIPMPVQ